MQQIVHKSTAQLMHHILSQPCAKLGMSICTLPGAAKGLYTFYSKEALPTKGPSHQWNIEHMI